VRRARFKVPLRFDGAEYATVLIEEDGEHQLIRVRPLRARNEEVMHLADIAAIVLERGAKARARMQAAF
jgi:hypothetical protein